MTDAIIETVARVTFYLLWPCAWVYLLYTFIAWLFT
jgi:hypothetical protein